MFKLPPVERRRFFFPFIYLKRLPFLHVLSYLLLMGFIISCEPVLEVHESSKINFEEVSISPENFEKYPFLKEEKIIVRDDVDSNNPEMSPRVYVSNLDDKCFGSPVFIVYYVSPYHCGSHGCQIDIHEYDVSLSLGRKHRAPVSHIPVYEKSCNKNRALIFTGGGGSSGFHEWECAFGELSYKATHLNINDAMKCY